MRVVLVLATSKPDYSETVKKYKKDMTTLDLLNTTFIYVRNKEDVLKVKHYDYIVESDRVREFIDTCIYVALDKRSDNICKKNS